MSQDSRMPSLWVRSGLARLTLAKPIAEAVRSDDVKHFPIRAVVLLGVEFGDFFSQTFGLEFLKQIGKILHVKCTAVLRRIAAVFRQSYLDVVTTQHGRLVRCVAARQDLEAEH